MRRYTLVPVVLWVLGILLVVLLSQRERHVELDRLALETRVTGEQVQLRLEACLGSRVALVRALSGYWDDVDGIRAEWQPVAGSLINLFPGIQALNFVDPDSVIRIVVPEAPNRAALGRVLLENPNPSVVAAISKANAMLTRTNPIELLQSGKGFTVYDRIESPSGRLLGYANGVFRIDDLMRACLFEATLERRFQLALAEPLGGETFFTKPDQTAEQPWDLSTTFDVQLADRPWKLIVAPHPSLVANVGRETASLILFFGISVVSLLAFLTWLLLLNQRSLRASQRRYQFLVENQSDFVVEVGGDGRLTYANPAFCRSQGRASSELLGERFLDFIDPDPQLVDAARAELTRPPYSVMREVRTSTIAGFRWVAWSCSAVLDANGEISVVNCTGRDLTDMKAMEERVAHSDKMKALGEMAGGITHDFNNLLQVMLGTIEFMIDDVRGTQREQLEQVEHAIQRAMNLTSKLSTLSRQGGADPQQLDLSGFVREVVDLLRRSLPSTISVQLEAPVEPIYVMADASQIEQVFLNLCFNAKDSIETHGTIRIVLAVEHLDAAFCRIHPEVEPGMFARLSVIDDGSGIEDDVLPKIFDPFFTTKGIGEGHGLGLANCDSLVRQHNGIILADSAVGYGSTFTVYLPIVEVPRPARAVAEPSAGPASSSRSTVLIVDDNEDVMNLTQRILSAAGYRTLTAANGYDGVVTFQEHQNEISMVIMDLVMPVMDGREAAAKIRELAPDVFILFSSGFVPADGNEQVLTEPLLKKPFKSRELLDYAAMAHRGIGDDAG